MKVGLYFGSFNPVHIGHLIIVNHILNESTLDKIWFVVSPLNPFKEQSTLLHEYDRLHLVQKAIADDTRLRASDIEFNLPKPSYTIHTLAYLEEKYSEHEFSIIMGSDGFQNILKWKNAEQIIARYEIIVYERPGFAVNDTFGARVSIMKAPLLEISATYIRELLKKGKSVRYLVPQEVEEELLPIYKKNQKK